MNCSDQASLRICPVCTAVLSRESVLFATGYRGTRAQLYARVCQYNRDSRCLNWNKALLGEILREDEFPSERYT